MFLDECFFTFSAKNGIVENSLRILDLCRTPETDSMNPWGSIEPRLRTIGMDGLEIKSHQRELMFCFHNKNISDSDLLSFEDVMK